jgi:CheY-like chemotaxis protein
MCVFPDADGRDLLQQLKQNPITTGIPVIAWSGAPHESLRLSALALGAEAFVEKGNAETLLPKIARVLLRRDQERAARDSFWPAGNAHPSKW